MIYSYLEIGLKSAIVNCLTNALAPPLIALKSCSKDATSLLVFTRKKFFWLGVVDFLCVTSSVK